VGRAFFQVVGCTEQGFGADAYEILDEREGERVCERKQVYFFPRNGFGGLLARLAEIIHSITHTHIYIQRSHAAIYRICGNQEPTAP